MKNKVFTAISTVMCFIPWTLFPLRMNDWALQSPTAEIMIGCYIALMVFSGIFTSVCYVKGGVRNKLMQVCMVINDVYAFGGVVLGAWAIYSALA